MQRGHAIASVDGHDRRRRGSRPPRAAHAHARLLRLLRGRALRRGPAHHEPRAHRRPRARGHAADRPRRERTRDRLRHDLLDVVDDARRAGRRDERPLRRARGPWQRRRRRAHRRLPGALSLARRRSARLADRARQPSRPRRLRPRGSPALPVASLRSPRPAGGGAVKIVKPGAEHDTPRGILGGAELSQATTGATNIYMAKFRVPPGARSRPHYHANCESGLYMLSGRIAIHWGEHREQTLEVEPGDLLYVPPRETHVVVNLSDDEPADYVVARDSPTEGWVEVPWADEGQL